VQKTLDRTTADKIRELVRLNRESHKGFDKARELCSDDFLVVLFADLGAQRRRFASELAERIPNPENVQSETLLAKMHRWWMDLRTTLSTDEAVALLSEIERAEDVMKKGYHDVLLATVGDPVNELIRSQHAAILESHDRIRDLRDQAKARASA